MQHTIEFENELHRRYPPLDENVEERKVAGDANNKVKVVGGRVEVEASGNADDIKAKYASASTVSHDTNELKNHDVFDRL